VKVLPNRPAHADARASAVLTQPLAPARAGGWKRYAAGSDLP